MKTSINKLKKAIAKAKHMGLRSPELEKSLKKRLKLKKEFLKQEIKAWDKDLDEWEGDIDKWEGNL